MDLKVYFDAAEVKLAAELKAVRAMLQHSGNKGTSLEAVFREFLRNHISRSHDVGHGEVIDRHGSHAGSTSADGQIDVLVIDDDHPRFAKITDPSLYFIEGVLAAGEIKTALKLSDAEEIVEKAAAFKRLRTVLAYGDISFTNEEDLERFLNRRPYFLFAFNSETPLEAFYGRVLQHEASLGLTPTDHLDAIFLLDRGAAVNIGNGRGGLKVLDSEGQPTAGWIQETRPVMIALISWLSEVMPRITRFSPVVRHYLTRSSREIADEQAQARDGGQQGAPAKPSE